MKRFVVHEHHSKSLLYDFRLEIGGVLKPWAIPKGPSMSPKDRRLAIMVDDHPLEYGNFEGIIPDNYYGAGAVIIWDSGNYEPVQIDLDKKHVEFILHGTELKGAFVLTGFKGNNWLLIKRKDEFARYSYVTRPKLTNTTLKKLDEKRPPCNIHEL